MQSTRREFFKQSAVAGAAAFHSLRLVRCPACATAAAQRPRRSGRRNRLKMAAIGVGGSRGAYSQGTAVAMRASEHAKMIAVCDVDKVHMDEFNAKFDKKLNLYPDYRNLLEKEKPDIVTIGTPDHWHVPIAIAALQAGCDVYCEKPLTLTIEEGFRIRDAVKETGRVFQVGTQQRSEHGLLFLKAIAIVQSGRLGKKVNADIAIGGGMEGGPFPNHRSSRRPQLGHVGRPRQQGRLLARAPQGVPLVLRLLRRQDDRLGRATTSTSPNSRSGHEKTGPVKITLEEPTTFTPIVPDHFNWHDYFRRHVDAPQRLPHGHQVRRQAALRQRLDRHHPRQILVAQTARRISTTASSSPATKAASSSTANASPASRSKT